MTKHIVVIGAGIVGACIAFQLVREGARVTIIEAKTPACEASSRSIGWINASFIEREDYYRLRLAAIAAHRAWDEAFKGRLQTQWTGAIGWEAQPEDLASLADELSRYGHPARLIDAREFKLLEPEFADPPDAAVFLENEGTVDAAHAVHVILAEAVALGARVVTGSRVHVIEPTGGGFDVLTSAGRVSAEDVVVAAGAGTQAIAELGGSKLPMANDPGLLIETNKLPFHINNMIWSPDVHFKQLPNGRLVSGEVFSGAMSEDDGFVLADSLLRKLENCLVRAPELCIEELKYGLRPVPADGYPVIGRLENNVYVSVMHSGVTLAPVVAELVAKEILSDERAQMLAGFGADRFPAE